MATAAEELLPPALIDKGYESQPRGGGRRVIKIWNGDLARKVLNNTKLGRAPTDIAILGPAMGRSAMLLSNGSPWQDIRKTIASFFTAAYVRGEHFPAVEHVAGETFQGIANQSRAAGGPVVIDDVERLMRMTTLRILGQIMFRRPFTAGEVDSINPAFDRASTSPPNKAGAGISSEVAKKLIKVSREGRAGIDPVLPESQMDGFAEVRSWLDRFISELPKAEKPSLWTAVHNYHAARDPENGRELAIGEMIMFMFAGIETTASTLTFAAMEITKRGNEAILERVLQEIDRERKAPNSNFMRRFPYLRAVVNEVLRDHTVVRNIERAALEPWEFEGEAIQPGANFKIDVRAIHHNPVIWGPDHDQFIPDRMAELTPEQDRNFIPFGFGPQLCPGRTLALEESVNILQHLFSTLQISPIEWPSGELYLPTPIGIARPNGPIQAMVCARA